MNNELIKRIDFAMQFTDSEVVRGLVDDMKAEIERLLVVNDSLRGLNNEYVAKSRKQTEKIERLSKPYVPMTDDDFISLIEKTETFNRYSGWEWEGEVESAVIARYNEQRGVK